MILKLVYKRLHSDTLPSYITLRKSVQHRQLRNSVDDTILWTPLDKNTFEGVASRLFNSLPRNIRSETKKVTFNNLCHSYLLDRELTRQLSS